MAHSGTDKIRGRVPFEALVRRLGREFVATEPAELEFFSSDVYRVAEHHAAVVVSPGTVEETADVARLCYEAGLAIIPRGGGLSYTGGYLPTTNASAIFDLRRLTRIIEINAEDMYVTVEVGCTWKALYEALASRRLRTPYFGPMSGYASTIGGALSQGSVFLGSTQYGSTAESTLGLEIVLVNGTRLVTGSAASRFEPSPFFRTYGPDLTGLFLGDAGALGIKVRATLRLIPQPLAHGFASFTFPDVDRQLSAMSAISRAALAADCFGADPYVSNLRIWDQDGSEDVKRLLNIAQSGRTRLSGLADAARVAIRGRRALKGIEYGVHVAVEDRTEASVAERLDEIHRLAATSEGKAVESTIPRTTRATPFVYPNSILGPRGERWITQHGIVPHSRAVEVAHAVSALFGRRGDQLARFGIEWGFVLFAISTSAILYEPMMYWPDETLAYHRRIIEPAVLAKLKCHEPNPQAREAVHELRLELSELFMHHGCAHLQIGKWYRYAESREPATLALLEAIKRGVDPAGAMNPGALGLASPGDDSPCHIHDSQRSSS